LRDLQSGGDLVCEDPQCYRTRYGELLDRSEYRDMRAQDASAEEAATLEKRLRDLGYLE